MPRVKDIIRDCVVYLYPSEEAAHAGDEVGGSGFLVHLGYKIRKPTYAVTNKHVIKEGSPYIRINMKNGAHDVLRGEWEYHEDGDDIAVCEVELTKDHQYQAIHKDLFLTEPTSKNLDIGLGDDLFMAGRFVNHGGKHRNLPTIRFGTIAMMPDEPIIDEGHEQECFLAEIHSTPGYSGSPVIVHLSPDRIKHLKIQPKRWPLEEGAPLERLLGIEWSRLKGEVKQFMINGGPINVLIPSGISGVIPAWKIADVLDNCEKFKMQREKRENESVIEHTSVKPKKGTRKNRDIPIPPISRKEFFN